MRIHSNLMARWRPVAFSVVTAAASASCGGAPPLPLPNSTSISGINRFGDNPLASEAGPYRFVNPQSIPPDVATRLIDLRSGVAFTAQSDIAGFSLRKMKVVFYVPGKAPKDVQKRWDDKEAWVGKMPNVVLSIVDTAAKAHDMVFLVENITGVTDNVDGWRIITDVRPTGRAGDEGQHRVSTLDSSEPTRGVQTRNIGGVDKRVRDIEIHGQLAMYEDPQGGGTAVVFEVVLNPDVDQSKIAGNEGTINTMIMREAIAWMQCLRAWVLDDTFTVNPADKNYGAVAFKEVRKM